MTTQPQLAPQFSTPSGLQAIELRPAKSRQGSAHVFGDFIVDSRAYSTDTSVGGFDPLRMNNLMSNPTKSTAVLGAAVRKRFRGLPFSLTRAEADENAQLSFDSLSSHVCVALTAVVIHWQSWVVTDTKLKMFAAAQNEVFVIPRFCTHRLFFGEMLIFRASSWLGSRHRHDAFGSLADAGEPARLEPVVTEEGFESYEFPRDTDSAGVLGSALKLELLRPRSEGWVTSQISSESPHLLYLADGEAILAAEGHEGRMSIGAETALLLCAQDASYRLGSHGLLVRASIPSV